MHKLEFGEEGKRTVVLKHPILKIMDSWRTAESLRLNTSTMEILVGIRTFMNFCERCTAIGELSYQDCGSISIPQYLLLYIKISKIVLNL